MKIVRGDIWEFMHRGNAVVIPTNIETDKNGHAIMGKGLAQQARLRFNWLPEDYGNYLHTVKHEPQHVAVFDTPQGELWLTPTKTRWDKVSPIYLVTNNIKLLAAAEKGYPMNVGYTVPDIYVPLLGCGYGHLCIDDVLPVMAQYLTDRFTLVIE